MSAPGATVMTAATAFAGLPANWNGTAIATDPPAGGSGRSASASSRCGAGGSAGGGGGSTGFDAGAPLPALSSFDGLFGLSDCSAAKSLSRSAADSGFTKSSTTSATCSGGACCAGCPAFAAG